MSTQISGAVVVVPLHELLFEARSHPEPPQNQDLGTVNTNFTLVPSYGPGMTSMDIVLGVPVEDAAGLFPSRQTFLLRDLIWRYVLAFHEGFLDAYVSLTPAQCRILGNCRR